MPSYPHLAVTTFRLDPEVAMSRTYYQLRFPGAWKGPLRRLAQSGSTRDVVSIPIRSLNDAIAALIPDSVITMSYASQGDQDQDWLLAYRKIDTRAVFNLVAAWVRSQKAAPEQITETLEQLRSDDLHWSQLSINFTSTDIRDNIFRLLPMEIAATLSHPDATSDHGDLRFRRCNAGTGAELISWPPLHIEEETPYSVKIGITAQTLPTSDELFVNVSFGVRRWMSSRAYLDFYNNHSVYLAPTIPYLTGLENSRHFGRARLKRTRSTDSDGATIYAPRWNDALADVLREAGCLARLPDPQQLTDKPMDYLQREGDAAALVYSTGMLGKGKEKVSAGLSLADRRPLVEWVARMLTPYLYPVEPLPRAHTSIYPKLHQHKKTSVQATIAPSQIYNVLGPRCDIELMTDTTQATAYALAALSKRLGIDLPDAEQLGDATVLVDMGMVTLGLRRVSTAEITADLDHDAKKMGKKVQAAAEARAAHIEKSRPRADVPTVTLVEIAGLDTYCGPHRMRDPLFAIRHGLLRTGRLSQFVTPVVEPKKSSKVRKGPTSSNPNKERFDSSVDELFRQLGVRAEVFPQPLVNTLECQPAMLAFWVIRKNESQTRDIAHQIPIAILIDPTGQDIQISAPEVEWQSLRTGLLEIGRKYVNVDLKIGSEGITRFIKETISEVVGVYPDILMLTHAQNLRSAWKFLANTQLECDVLKFGAKTPQPISRFPGLRHVRVRTSDGGETPECFGVNSTEMGQPKGLWGYLVDRVFGSTTDKPVTASTAVKSVSKIVPHEDKGKLFPPKANKQVWNQQFIELFVAAVQPDDKPDHWAALAHELRWAAPYTKGATTLPWPLHVATKIEEYLLPITVNDVAVTDQNEESDRS